MCAGWSRARTSAGRSPLPPDSSADVTIALNVTTDCEAAGAICTEDGRKLSAPLELTVNGPDQQPANPDPADLAPTNLAVRVDG